MTKSLGDAVASDNEPARRGVKPQVLTDIYGTRPPKAAEFGRGAQTIADIRDATDKQQRQRPGAYRER